LIAGGVGGGIMLLGVAFVVAILIMTREPTQEPRLAAGTRQDSQPRVPVQPTRATPRRDEQPMPRPREQPAEETKPTARTDPPPMNEGFGQPSKPPVEAKPEKSHWDVEPDPAEASFKGPFSTGFLKIPFGMELAYPTGPSPYVAAIPANIGNDGVGYVFDLRTLKQVGKPLRGTFSVFSEASLSQDGTYLAVKDNDKGTNALDIYSVATGRSVSFQLDQRPDIYVNAFDFVGKDRLFTTKQEGKFPSDDVPVTCQVWDLATGQVLAEYIHPGLFNRRFECFTPGRRYLISEEVDTIKGYWLVAREVATGKIVGEFEFQHKTDKWGGGCGMAVSPDGKELALLWRVGERPDTWGRIRVWDLATKKQVCDHHLGYTPNHLDSLAFAGGDRSIQWLPDGSGWLVCDHLVVSCKNGMIVNRIPPEPTDTTGMVQHRFLDVNMCSQLEGRHEKKLSLIKLDGMPKKN
jgi:hypothetical protein